MNSILISWIGHADLRAPQGEATAGIGPVGQALSARVYDAVTLISDYPQDEVSPFLEWLRPQTRAHIEVSHEPLSSPTDFGEIYEAAVRVVSAAIDNHGRDADLTFHLSPGTPAMAAVWIILAKTRFPAELIESSPEQGVRTASIPFEISAEFIPDLLRGSDELLEKVTAGLPPETPEFADIIYRSEAMARVVSRAQRVAPRNVPVLIQGESGTGKELFARAIHRAGLRRDCPFIAVNCGAIPAELMESELFGHEKGAFTGADRARVGYFEAADGGTLFLDEVGELSLSAQVKFLRILQDSRVLRVGSKTYREVDVRILAATNRSLAGDVAAGKFREDLFYRLAVADLKLPPLRERTGDLGLLVDRLLDQVNEDHAQQPGFKRKKITPSARNLLMVQPWPGNVRELLNTLHRAALWTSGPNIRSEDVREALLPAMNPVDAKILERPLGDDLSLPDLMASVARHYLARALDETDGNKSQAALLVGLPSYQTFTNWIKKYGVNG